MNTETPCALYLQRLAESGRRSMLSQLTVVRKMMEWPAPTEEQPFHTLGYVAIECLKRKRLAEGKSPRTINHLLNGLKCIVKTALLMGLVDEKQWIQVQAVKPLKLDPHPHGKALVSSSVRLLLTQCRKDTRPIGIRDTAILAVFLATGLRRSELAKLQVGDYDIKEQKVNVISGKGNKSRFQFLPDWVVPELNKWLLVRGLTEGSLFNPFTGGKVNVSNPISASSIYYVVTTRTAEIDGQQCSPHDLRRTYISELLTQDVDLLTVSKMAGHASVTTTQIYDKRDSKFMQQAITKLKY
ncbi:tyrosine-type recombinase/integrase [Colwellia sp. 12G3]|uniref:tyrosine-type recombinase/integrase n=1 Tax=Colwellia sp. 12G3 TaxID=2058299 RepID=UPI000C3310D1|nr:site-specific integrase [Colwellia sp. 12G3]PKI12949.1 site-specific integrase [Colwellia sp. 12G3]